MASDRTALFQRLGQVYLFAEYLNCRAAAWRQSERGLADRDNLILEIRRAFERGGTRTDSVSTVMEALRECGIGSVPPAIANSVTELLIYPKILNREERNREVVWSTHSIRGSKALVTLPQPSPVYRPFQEQRLGRERRSQAAIESNESRARSHLMALDETVDPAYTVINYLVSCEGVPAGLVRHTIQEWLNTYFKLPDEPHTRVAVTEICRRLNDLFFDVETPTNDLVHHERSNTVSNRELLDSIGEIRGFRNYPNWCIAIYLYLRFSRFVRNRFLWTGHSQLSDYSSALCSIEPAHIANRVFGQQLGLGGFNYVLRGGLRWWPDRGQTIVVSGAPGSGKTFLALGILADVARRSGVGVYLTVEEHVDVMMERLHSLKLLDDERFEAVPIHSLGQVQELNWEPSKGKLLLLSAGMAGVSQLGNTLKELFGTNDQPGSIPDIHKLRAFALDSVDTLNFVHGGLSVREALNNRIQLRELVWSLESQRLLGIVISEESADNQFEKLRYLADTVISLGWDADRRERWLDISKCRHQPFHTGRHAFRISTSKGVRLSPNLGAVRNTLRKRVRTTLSATKVVPWPKSIAEPNPDWKQGVREKSSVLIHGPSGLGKSTLALHLLTEPCDALLKSPEGSGISERFTEPRNVLVVTFATPEVKFGQQLRGKDPRIKASWEKIELKHVRWYSPGDNLSGSQILDDLRNQMRDARRLGVPLERIVFDEIDAVEHFLPSVASEKLFWATLFELVSTEPLTSIFVSNSSEAASTEILRNSVDYSVRLIESNKGVSMVLERSEGLWQSSSAVSWHLSSND